MPTVPGMQSSTYTGKLYVLDEDLNLEHEIDVWGAEGLPASIGVYDGAYPVIHNGHLVVGVYGTGLHFVQVNVDADPPEVLGSVTIEDADFSQQGVNEVVAQGSSLWWLDSAGQPISWLRRLTPP